MLRSTILVALATCLASVASARKCQEIKIPVSLSARNAVFDLAIPATDIETNNFFLRNTWAGTNYTEELLKDYATISGEYHLQTTYCTPDHGPGHVLQILTHGVGFDRTYWDAPWNNGNYSYVARAVDEFGYSTLTWDRLGIGQSSHGNPLNEIQVFLEIAALHELTRLFSSPGGCAELPTTYSSIVHAGHSFGSIITYNLVNLWPTISKGIALTGFSQVPDFLDEFVLGAGFVPVKDIPQLKDKYATGYYAPASKVGVQTNFFGPGDFDPEILQKAFETGQPFAAGEMLTVGAGIGVPNAEYAGPVLVITGDRDIPFCGGNCSKKSAAGNGDMLNAIENSESFFPKASVFNATIVANAGHGLNYGYSHDVTYATILDFFQKNAK